MIVVDSSVWVDYLRGDDTAEAQRLDGLLGTAPLAIGDLILAEVLQGTDSDGDFDKVLDLLSTLEIIDLGGRALAIEAARNFRRLRRLGVTVRKTIDTVIATRCLLDDHHLLFSDRDFLPFAQHLGLRSAMAL